jgi:FlaG/FlaF family flagellin (archaellin)
MRRGSARGDGGLSTTVGTVLLIALAVLLAGFVGAVALDYLEQNRSGSPPVVGITVEKSGRYR